MISKIPFIGSLVLGPLAAIYTVLGAAPLFAQAQTGIVPIITNDPVSEYLTKGGSYALIALILFFYRRDYSKALESKTDAMEIATRMVEASTKAQTESAIALNASTLTIAANTQALQRLIDRLAPLPPK